MPPPYVGTPEAVSSPAIDAGHYLDDRSTAEEVVRSFYNAINRREYARAYSYWEAGVSTSQLPPFDQFQRGYANTQSVELTLGQVTGGVGAGQLYYSVPVTLTAHTSGGQQTFAGCYTLHLARPELQAVPPFHPLAIQSAHIAAVPAGGNPSALMQQACH